MSTEADRETAESIRKKHMTYNREMTYSGGPDWCKDDGPHKAESEIFTCSACLVDDIFTALQAARAQERERHEIYVGRSLRYIEQMLEWDCLTPTPRVDLLGDLPWLKRMLNNARIALLLDDAGGADGKP